MESTRRIRRRQLSIALFLIMSGVTVPRQAAAQLSGTYFSAPGTTVTYQFQNPGFPTTKLPADVTVTFSGDDLTTLVATIHQPIIGDVPGNSNFGIVNFFPLQVIETSNDGRDFEGELLGNSQYYFDWQFDPANGGNLKWTGNVAWVGGRIEVSTIDDGALLIPAVPGDYNRNGVVDAPDYVVWRDELADGGRGYADGNQDGSVDAADYDVWKAHFGQTAAAALAGGAAPEPATFALILAGLLAIACRRGQARIF